MRAGGGSIILTDDPAEAVSGVEAVYADVWTSMGREAEVDARRRHSAGSPSPAS